MRYLGGKSRIAKPISEAILAATSDRTYYFEPFMGSGSVSERMVQHFRHAQLSDAAPDLIALWRALQGGWAPPESVSEEEYQTQRNAPVSAMRGFVGYGCSFGGKWFGGYARNDTRNDYASQSRNSLLRKAGTLRAASIRCASYKNLVIFNNAIVYCDPPYRDTTGYDRTGCFDSDAFWLWAEWLSRRACVFVSEYSAPEGWVSVWHGTPQAALDNRQEDTRRRASEHLWTRTG